MPMKIEVERGGGFAGMVRRQSIDTDGRCHHVDNPRDACQALLDAL
jgi:hypothetical protein